MSNKEIFMIITLAKMYFWDSYFMDVLK